MSRTSIERVVAGGATFDIEITAEMLAHASDCAAHVAALMAEAAAARAATSPSNGLTSRT
jgi:hypothetical protein